MVSTSELVRPSILRLSHRRAAIMREHVLLLCLSERGFLRGFLRRRPSWRRVGRARAVSGACRAASASARATLPVSPARPLRTAGE